MYGVYVHIPWCRAQCPYCDFAISVTRAPPHAAYTDALLREWALRRPLFDGTPETLSFGGGTPSRAPAASIARLVEAIAPTGEISLEANPADHATFADLRAAGVNRLSIGVQSFDPVVAARLGRRRDAEAAPAALRAARAAGFPSVSLDLIFGVPGQTLDQLLADLDTALTYAPDHVSLYGLTIETGTPFGRQGVVPVDEDLWREMYDAAVARLREAGLQRYEISNFAREGHRSRHNEHYWRARPWAALGVGAHAWWPDGTRAVNVRDTKAYIAASDPVESAARPAPDELAVELLGSMLRHVDGLDRELLRAHTGLDVRPPDALVQAGIIEANTVAVRLTDRGMPLADAVVARLVATLSHAPTSPGSRFVRYSPRT